MSSTLANDPEENLPRLQLFARFEKLRPDATLPKRMSENAAAFDLFAADDAYINSEYRSHVVIGTGVRIRLRPHEVGLVCSRSGLAAKEGVFVLNSPGIIDPDYEGELKVILATYRSNSMLNVKAGDRIAQLLVVYANAVNPFLASANLFDRPTARGNAGLGSTGV